MVVVIADSGMRNVRQIEECTLDMAYGSDENDFELTCEPELAPEPGGYIFVDGTEWGGTVDEIESDTSTRMVTCRGRTWHGIWHSKIMYPRSGEYAVSVSGGARNVLQTLIDRYELGSLFVAIDGVDQQVNWTFDRFVDGYTGLLAMAAGNSLRLSMVCAGGSVEMSLVPIDHYGDTVDSDLMDFVVTKTDRRTNHLVCGGTGEGKNRAIVHFYADRFGQVSHTQSLFGVDEIAAFYDYTNADESKLEEDGRKQLEALQSQGDVSVDAHEDIQAEVGDSITARDNMTGTEVTDAVSKKILKLERGVPTYEYEVGEATTGTSGSLISGTAESSGGGHAYYAGEGLTLTNYTFSADVTDTDLDATNQAVKAAATAASNADAAAGRAQTAAVTAQTIADTAVTNAATAQAAAETAQTDADAAASAAAKAQTTADGKADKDHTHSAADITSGTLDVARLPVIPITQGGTGNTDGKAQALVAARTITLTGAVTGSASFDGSQDITITTTGDSAAAGFLAAHPVGFYVESTVNPSTIGGVWEAAPSVGAYKWLRTK